LSAHAEQIIQQSFSNLRRPTTWVQLVSMAILSYLINSYFMSYSLSVWDGSIWSDINQSFFQSAVIADWGRDFD
jgi:hypothetical protein